MRILIAISLGLLLVWGSFVPANAFSSRDVQIFLLKGSPNRLARKLRKMTPAAGYKYLRQLRNRRLGAIRATESRHTVVYVINSKMRAGTRIVTQHQFARPIKGGLKRLNPYRFSYTVKRNHAVKPLVILNMSKAGGTQGGKLHYSLFVNGRKMKEVSVEIR